MPGRRPLLALVILGLVLLSQAPMVSAHPFDASFYSARASVRLDDKRGLRVQVFVEVPASKVLEKFLELYGDPAALDEEANELFRRQQLDSLAEDLVLRFNGRRPSGSWLPMEDPVNGLGTADFFIYMLEFKLDDPAAVFAKRMDVRVDMNVLAREFIYLNSRARAKAPWQLVSDSAEAILAKGAEDLRDPETGQWSLDPRLRNLRIVFERAKGEPVPDAIGG